MSDECTKQFCPQGSRISTYHLPVMNTSIAMNMREMPSHPDNTVPNRQSSQSSSKSKQIVESSSKKMMFQNKNNSGSNNRTISSTKKVPYQAKYTKPIYRRDGDNTQYIPERHRPGQRNQSTADEPLGDGLWAVNHDSNESTALQLSPMPETTKLKLIIILQKLKQENLEYSLISQYFSKMFSQIEKKYPNHRTLALTLRDMLVYDRDELKNNKECYTNSIDRVRRASYVDFSVIYQIVDGLASIMRGI